MYNELDGARAKRELENVPKGSVGTILMVFNNGDDDNCYLVEFFDTEFNSLDVLMVTENDLEK